MTVIDDVLQEEDIGRLARMHVAALPGSLISLLGERYARTFYRYCAASDEELLLLERDGGALTGACLASLAPETLSRRLLTRTPLLLFAPLAVLRLPLRVMLFGAPQHNGASEPRGPEILLIFTLPEVRGRGLGARLLARCERALVARGLHDLMVKTRDDPENRALRFYERAGFHSVTARTKYGKRLRLLRKSLQYQRAT